MRSALALCLAACAGCGDNEPACGHVQALNWNRNIWGGHIAVDGELVHYTDYDNGVGTKLLFRQPRDGGQALVIAARDTFSRIGFDMVASAGLVYWSAELEPFGYVLLATPVTGAGTVTVMSISECTATGVAIDGTNAYASSLRCNNGIDDLPARVVAGPLSGGDPVELWSSSDADVADLVAFDGEVVLATTGGLIRIGAAGTTLLDGRSSFHVELAGDEIVYSTDDAIVALPIAGGAGRTLYEFRTPITNPRAFAIDAGDLYVSDSPELVFVPQGGELFTIVHDMGAAITHIVARDGFAYWATLAVPGSLGPFGTFSGGVLRVMRPCS
ncbi:MAG TPA: hypothetical protein VIV11_20005 [Kofleriaceae bacterium]